MMKLQHCSGAWRIYVMEAAPVLVFAFHDNNANRDN